MATIKFWQEMQRVVTIDGQDKLMIGKNSNGEAQYVNVEDLNQFLSIGGQRMKAVPPGVLPAGPSGQTRYMELFEEGIWSYNGFDVATNPLGAITNIWWDGSNWEADGTVLLPKGADGEDGENGTNGTNGINGKTTEPFNASKVGGYLIGDTVYFGESAIYSALVNVPMGESPLTHPAKWKAELKVSIKDWTAKAYRQGDQVISRKIWWEAVINTTAAQEPGIVAETIWKKVTEGSVKDLGLNPNLDLVLDPGVYSFSRILGAGGTSTLKGTEKNMLIVSDISSTRGNEKYQYIISGLISFRKQTVNGWTAFTPYLDGITDITSNLYARGRMSWNIINPTALHKCDSVLWGESGLIVDGTTNIYYHIPVDVDVEYISKSGSMTFWCYDSDKKPITGTKVTVAINVPFKFTNINTKTIGISNFVATPILGKNIPADFTEPFSVKIDKRDIRGLPNEDYVGTIGNARSLYEAGITASGSNYTMSKTGNNNYNLKTKFNIENLHNVDADIPLISINNGTEDVVKVELLNRKTSRGFGIMTINSAFRLTTKQNSREVNVTGIVNQMAGRDYFSIRRVDPTFSGYKFMQSGVYNEALDIANYTLQQADLGWIIKIDEIGLTITRYNVTVISDILTIGTDAQETISAPFGVNESLDDYLKRLPTILGNRFEVKTRHQDYKIKCVNLVHGEIQMCRWFKPLKTIYRRVDVPSRLLSVFIVDAISCQLQIQRESDIDLVLSYYDNSGWRHHYLVIDDVIIIRDRVTTLPLYTGNQTITFNSSNILLKSMSHNLFDYYLPVPIIAFTGHWQIDMPEFLVASEAIAQIGYRTTTGRITRIMNEMKNRGFEQITIEEFREMKIGLKPWRKAFFWCMDDSVTALTSNGTYENKIGVHQKLIDEGYAFTVGINMCSMDGQESSYETPLTQVDVDYYKQYGELFNHSYFHSSHAYLTALQIIYFLDMHQKLIRLHGLRVQSMYALPFNEGSYFITRMIASYGYQVITSHFGSNYNGAIFKGTNNFNLSRITGDDVISVTQLETFINNIGIYGGRYDYYG